LTADAQPDTFARTQAHAVSGKEKDLIAQPDGSGKQPLHLFNGQDIRDTGSLWRFDQGNCLPGFVEYPEVKKLQAIKIEFDSTPGVFFQEFAEIIKRLVGCKVVNPAIEIVPDAPDCPGICLDGLGVQARQPQAFPVFLIILVELWIIWDVDVHCNLLFVIIEVTAYILALSLSFYYKKNTRSQDVNSNAGSLPGFV